MCLEVCTPTWFRRVRKNDRRGHEEAAENLREKENSSKGTSGEPREMKGGFRDVEGTEG